MCLCRPGTSVALEGELNDEDHLVDIMLQNGASCTSYYGARNTTLAEKKVRKKEGSYSLQACCKGYGISKLSHNIPMIIKSLYKKEEMNRESLRARAKKAKNDESGIRTHADRSTRKLC
jgi:hypothetical protein